MRKSCLAVLALAAVLGACSSQQGAQSSASPSASPLKNPLDFPLYTGAQIISARSFTQTINAQSSSGNSLFSAGNGTYDGHEVIASSGGSFTQLSTWVKHLDSQPPAGYDAVDVQAIDAHQRVERFGVDYATFERKIQGKTHGVLVIVMDPQRVNQRFGAVLGLISKFKSLPAAMRGPIDDQVKARIGMTVTQATQPDSPIGAALDALNQFEDKSSRGIVVLDAAKR